MKARGRLSLVAVLRFGVVPGCLGGPIQPRAQTDPVTLTYLGPYLRAIARATDQMLLLWKGRPGLRLQRTRSLIQPEWTDVADSDGRSRIEWLPSGSNDFFRLHRP
ncbi:MAG: hypothetical protein FJ387_25680 [Verrucomicrobia bacterium]|nr:hypothetical protein [Verrucomicrobiota bacterium]